MCGRFTLRTTPGLLESALSLFDIPELPPRFNICPTQNVAAMRFEAASSKPAFVTLRWGLIPAWAKTLKDKPQPINAKSETVAESRMFKKAFETKRCVILADGFYEWTQAGDKKQPHFIHLASDEPFAFAGLWSHWESKSDGEVVESCTIMTTEANELMKPIHTRMPVILDRTGTAAWLKPDRDAGNLTPLMQPFPAHKMATYTVALLVNNPRNDVPECIKPLELP